MRLIKNALIPNFFILDGLRKMELPISDQTERWRKNRQANDHLCKISFNLITGQKSFFSHQFILTYKNTYLYCGIFFQSAKHEMATEACIMETWP